MSRLTDGELADLIVDYTPRPAPMGRCRLLVSNGDATVIEALEELLRLRAMLARETPFTEEGDLDD